MGLDAQALQNRRPVDLQAVVIGQPTPRDEIDEQREQLRDEGSRPRPRLQHVARIADDNISFSRVTEELAEGGPSPREFFSHTGEADRKSTRLNSSHANISYAVFCLKKKMTTH